MPSKAYFFVSWNSLAATSSASTMSSPSLKPACLTASAIRSSACAVAGQLGGEAALVADTGGQALLLQHRLEGVVDLGALLQRLGNDAAPIGAIMNSWMSTLVSAWAPPLRMFIIGTGSRWALGPPT